MLFFLLRYLPHLLIIVSAISAVGYFGYKMHQNGRVVERAEWQERESGRIAMQTQLVAEAEKNNASERDLRYSNLMGVVNAQAKLNNDLQRDLDSVSGRRLYISAKACGNDNGSVPGASQNTGEPGSRSRRVELFGQDAENIRRDYTDAQRVVNQYLLCRQALIGIADIKF
jgi:hypothetical protein